MVKTIIYFSLHTISNIRWNRSKYMRYFRCANGFSIRSKLQETKRTRTKGGEEAGKLKNRDKKKLQKQFYLCLESNFKSRLFYLAKCEIDVVYIHQCIQKSIEKNKKSILSKSSSMLSFYCLLPLYVYRIRIEENWKCFGLTWKEHMFRILYHSTIACVQFPLKKNYRRYTRYKHE